MKRIITGRKWGIMALFIGLLILSPVQAQDKPVSSSDKQVLDKTSKIERVTVYQDRALVTRHVELHNLQPGIYEVVIKGLPVRIQDESVRAAGLDRTKVKILDVEIKTYQLEKAPEDKICTLQDQLQSLQDEIRIIDDNIKLLRRVSEYLKQTQDTFFKTAVQPITVLTEGGKDKQPARLNTNDFNTMLEFLSGKFEHYVEAVRVEEIKKRNLTKKLVFVQSELNKLGVRQSSIPRQKSVKVNLEVLEASSNILEISYINYSVTWKPSYDVRVLTEDKEMEVIGYGVVSQNSGEDWTDVKLAFSTAQPALRGWLPELKPLYVAMPQQVPRQTYAGYNIRKGLSQDASNKDILSNQGYQSNSWLEVNTQTAGEASPEASAYLPGEAVARFGSVVFHTPKRTSIASDNAPHRTALFQQKFPIKFEYTTCPKTSPHVYLKVIGTNTMDVPFLRGTLNIFMGSDFVGSSFTSGILPTEEFEMSLTVDENVRVTRKLEEKEEKGPGFLGSRKKISYTFMIKLENYKKEAIVINIIDQIPVSQSKEVTIEKGEFSIQPLEEKKDGTLIWRFEMKPKEAKELTFTFNVFVPKNKTPAFYNEALPVMPTIQPRGSAIDTNRFMEMKQRKK